MMNARSVMTVAGLDVRTELAISEVDRAQWDRLVGPDNFYNSYDWLLGLELAHGDTRAVTVSQAGTLLAGLPVWPGEHEDRGLFCPAELFPDVPATWPTDLLWLGGRRSTYNELVCEHGPQRRRVLTTLLQAALESAFCRGARGVIMPYLTVQDARALACTHPDARYLLHDAEASLDIPTGGLAEHLAGMPKHDRSRRRSELRACDRAGTRIAWRPLVGDDLVPAAADLITQNRSRHGSTAGPRWMLEAFAAQQASGVLRRAVGCFGFRDGRPIAVLVCYTHHDRLFARYYGFDYHCSTPAAEYFVLAYCAAVDYAAERGLRRYRLGVSAPLVKIRRGASLIPLAAVVLLTDRPVCSTRQADDANRAFVARWRALCHSHPAATGVQWDSW